MQRSPSAVSHTRRVVSKPKGGSIRYMRVFQKFILNERIWSK